MNTLLRNATRLAVPRLMASTRSARRAAVLKATRWVTGRPAPEPVRRISPVALIGKGLLAALLALPLGLWIGRMVRRRGA